MRGASGRPPSCPPTCHTHTPRTARGSRHQAVEEQRGGEGGGAQKGRSPPRQLPTTTPQPAFFPLLFVLGESTAQFLEEMPAT